MQHVVQFKEIIQTPPAPPVGRNNIFSLDGEVYMQDSTGAVVKFSGSSGQSHAATTVDNTASLVFSARL